MIAVRTRLPADGTDRPPIILVHGAANSASVWIYWQQALNEAGWASHAVDLRGHGASSPVDLSRTSMHDYAADVVAVAEQLRQPPILVGWSMGGLVAMLASTAAGAVACVGLAPSTPARRVDESVPLRFGEFTAQEYGITSRNPDDQPAMPDLDLEARQIALGSLGRESRFARDERQRGIVIDDLSCPLLIVAGTDDRQWPRQRYDDLPFPAAHVCVEGASHWGLVLNRRALDGTIPAILSWLDRTMHRSSTLTEGDAQPVSSSGRTDDAEGTE
jgi:pimeloyl-ACP methyl ester carboxylesterase